ncbi:ferredoxin [Pseudonocardia dioxanivorans CB1190]|uniref:Ferredoxin n=1 Tax=Pseudonocardia dioxanivorans (strain ATCC 55486 / DSM 44775 / JCM 13855 / CB1190) TaxID=675635 RepID=F4CPB0_PSEUX|nr:ferredoxin reductase [Pseudonocardia dioxanivorans]AEA24025.1 ferredoxin [Pseudonocardia dioxanivorans CB1190]
MAPLGRRVLAAARALTTPLLPEDFLSVWRPLRSGRAPGARVVEVRPETADATTLFLRPGTPLPAHRPGQFVGLGVPVDGVWTWRSYSVTSRPGESLLAVTVTAVPDGAVSTLLARRLRPGALVRITPPSGEFVLPAPTPEKLLFVTAGSGITPVMSMVRTLAATRPSVLDGAVHVHSDRTAADVVFGPELRALAARTGMRLVERHTATEGRLDPAGLSCVVPDWGARETWACGPADMLDDLVDHWDRAGDPAALHVERFRPPTYDDAAGTGGRVTFGRSGIVADAAPGTPVLAAGEAAGVLLPNGCRMGICHTCVGPLRSGAVRDLRTGELHDTPGQSVRTCVSAPTGDVTIDL